MPQTINQRKALERFRDTQGSHELRRPLPLDVEHHQRDQHSGSFYWLCLSLIFCGALIVLAGRYLGAI